MNRRQRLVLFVAAGAVALVLLFPPFAILGALNRAVRNMGHTFVLSPPIYYSEVAVVDAATLMVQILGLLAITALLYFALRDK